MTKRRALRYAVINAFARAPFKGNPAAVCFLEYGDEVDELWMQLVAREFNAPMAAFVSPDATSSGSRFHIRWFTPVREVELCGHATLAAAHFLKTASLSKYDVIEFVAKSGLLTTTVVPQAITVNEGNKNSIELDFPVIQLVDCDPAEIPCIPLTLNGATMVNIQKAAPHGDLLIELASGAIVADLKPNFNEIERCPGRGIVVTGLAPPGSEYDFFSRFFCPKLGINEDHVCGSAHCFLAPYWCRKLGKHRLVGYMASARSGRLDLLLDDAGQRVRIQGEAVTVMEGCLFA